MSSLWMNDKKRQVLISELTSHLLSNYRPDNTHTFRHHKHVSVVSLQDRKTHGCPTTVRMLKFRRLLCSDAHDGSAIDCYVEGASALNQRITGWWELYTSILLTVVCPNDEYFDRNNMTELWCRSIIQVGSNKHNNKTKTTGLQY